MNETAEVIEDTQSQETVAQETPVAFADTLGEEFKGNPNQASKVVDFLNDTFTQAQSQNEYAAQQIVNENRAELEQEWGNAMPQKLERARSAVVSLLGSDDIMDDIELADGTYLGDNPQIIRMFAALADQISEDPLGGPTSEQISTPAELEK